MSNWLSRFNRALDQDLAKGVFDHVRNYALGALILSFGIHELQHPSIAVIGLIHGAWPGAAVILLGCVLLGLNLYDGIRKLWRAHYPTLLMIALVVIYALLSLRVVQTALNFRLA